MFVWISLKQETAEFREAKRESNGASEDAHMHGKASNAVASARTGPICSAAL